MSIIQELINKIKKIENLLCREIYEGEIKKIDRVVSYSYLKGKKEAYQETLQLLKAQELGKKLDHIKAKYQAPWQVFVRNFYFEHISKIEIKVENFEELNKINETYQALSKEEFNILPEETHNKLLKIEEFILDSCPVCHSNNIIEDSAIGRGSKGEEIESSFSQCKNCLSYWND